MFSRVLLPCGNEGCPSGCLAFYYGIENTYTIGFHQNGLDAQMSPELPEDESELKYHLGFWFTDHGWDIADMFLSLNSPEDPPNRCFDTCPPLGRFRFAYGSVPVPDFHTLWGCVDGTAVSTLEGKSNEPETRRPRNLMVGLCWCCAESKAGVSRGELEAPSPSNPSATDSSLTSLTSDDTEPSSTSTSSDDTEPPSSPTVSAIQSRTPRTRPQTCFCDECENPPARYARLDDSDLED